MIDRRSYTITLEPRGKGRPVFTRATGTARTPETTRAWEHEAAHQLREQHAAQDTTGALDVRWTLLSVSIKAFYRRPKARPWYVPAHVWKDAKLSEMIPATSRHDLDNVVKIVLDALQIAHVVDNDRSVVHLDAAAYYVATGDEPGVSVSIQKVPAW